MTSPIPRRLAVISCFVACSVFGCSGVKPRDLAKSPVSGEVTLDGEHLPEGQIIFLHETGEMASANFKEDGLYKVNVAEGKNQVMVKSAEITGGAEGPNRAASMEIQKSRIPEKYMMPGQSGLEYVVTSGDNTYDVDLKSK